MQNAKICAENGHKSRTLRTPDAHPTYLADYTDCLEGNWDIEGCYLGLIGAGYLPV